MSDDALVRKLNLAAAALREAWHLSDGILREGVEEAGNTIREVRELRERALVQSTETEPSTTASAADGSSGS